MLAVFVAVYAGMALGRWPGLTVDRTGIALLGAIALHLAGAVDGRAALDAIDFETLVVLFGLMVLSAQSAAAGFSDRAAAAIAAGTARPERLVAATVAVGGAVSAVLANDVTVFAMTPVLCRGLLARGLDPRPFLIALAGAANAGSAATVIGNPQNILIAQAGDLGFWRFAADAGVPALIGPVAVHVTVCLVWRGRFRLADAGAGAAGLLPPVDRRQLAKAVLAAAVLVALFMAPLAQPTAVLAVAGFLLVSRRLGTGRMLALVDWHLLVLFAGLFVVTAGLVATGLPDRAVEALRHAALLPDRLAVMAPLALLASNTIGNVPAVVLVLAALPDLPAGVLTGLAVLSTLAGNLLLVGSLANLIVAERAREAGVVLDFATHARCGVPMTLASMAAATAWLWLAEVMAW